MKKITLVAMLAVAGALTSCVPSLHPLYTEGDLVFEPKLIGAWKNAADGSTWVINQAGDKAYQCLFTDKESKQGEFDGHLVKLDTHYVLDLYPREATSAQSPFYTYHFQPVHTFMLLPQVEPSLQMAAFNPDWLGKYLKDNPDAIRHEIVGERLVLTAGTAELKAFVAKHIATANAFGEPQTYSRLADAPAQPSLGGPK